MNKLDRILNIFFLILCVFIFVSILIKIFFTSISNDLVKSTILILLVILGSSFIGYGYLKFKILIKSRRKTKFSNQLKHLLHILPKDTRQEYLADISDIINEMKADNCNKYYIAFIVFINFVSVLYHAFFFKLQGYFYTQKQPVNRD